MAKDRGGHGSEARSGGGSYQNIDRNLRGPGKHVGYANGPWRIQKSDIGGYSAVHTASGASLHADTLGGISAKLDNYAKPIMSVAQSADYHAGGGQPVASNAHAAATLASGSKSAPVDTHPAMSKEREGFISRNAADGRAVDNRTGLLHPTDL